jgi:gamma-aminobutyric acid type B receptor
MSSPNINNLINLNCFLLYMCPILNSLKSQFLLLPHNQNHSLHLSLSNLMCSLNTWIIPVCSTLVYASMLMKAWRIYKIFENSSKIKKVIIKDAQLFGYIALIVLFDIFVLIIWQIFDPIQLRTRHIVVSEPQITRVNIKNLNQTVYDYDAGSSSPIIVQQSLPYKNEIKLLYECGSNFNEVWISVMTIYKLVLFMYGVYLAWLIRNINVPSMNDSKYLLLSTYAIIIGGLGSMTLMQVNTHLKY